VQEWVVNLCSTQSKKKRVPLLRTVGALAGTTDEIGLAKGSVTVGAATGGSIGTVTGAVVLEQNQPT
jgi:hypothetical protein